jgi:DNA repair exonuclease SbcCD ATPase subunit
LKQELLELAQRLRDKIDSKSRALKTKEEELRKQLNDVERERVFFEEKIIRFSEYNADSELCPICWINEGASFKFNPINGNDQVDRFKCSCCGEILEVKF